MAVATFGDVPDYQVILGTVLDTLRAISKLPHSISTLTMSKTGTIVPIRYPNLRLEGFRALAILPTMHMSGTGICKAWLFTVLAIGIDRTRYIHKILAGSTGKAPLYSKNPTSKHPKPAGHRMFDILGSKELYFDRSFL